MGEKKHYSYKTLDNTPRFLWWGLDEFACLLVPFLIGIFLEAPIVMLLGLPLKRFYSKQKKRRAKGALKHFLYWRLPSSFFSKLGVFSRLPPTHKKDFFL